MLGGSAKKRKKCKLTVVRSQDTSIYIPTSLSPALLRLQHVPQNAGQVLSGPRVIWEHCSLLMNLRRLCLYPKKEESESEGETVRTEEENLCTRTAKTSHGLTRCPVLTSKCFPNLNVSCKKAGSGVFIVFLLLSSILTLFCREFI